MQSILHPILGPSSPPHPDLTGKTAIVTGGALGIGYEISRALALEGARVIMVNRKEEQGDEAIEKIEKEAKEKGTDVKVEWVRCDLGDLKNVKEVFDGLRERLDRLDLLILSAGINANKYDLDADGIDRHFGVNALGHYYCINLLYPLIRRTSKLDDNIDTPPRIVFESSEMHRAAPSVVHFGSLDEINNPQLSPTELYGRTKLAMILYAKYGLVEKVIKKNGDHVYALSVHPGTVNTDMQTQWESAYPGLLGKVLKNLMFAAGRDPEQGAYSALYAALSDEVIEKGWNGWYLSDPGKPGKESAQASDPLLGAALWDLSERLVKKIVGEDALQPWDAKASAA